MTNSYVIAPTNDIILLKCPLEMDSFHQLDFANATAQYNYFHGLTKIEMNNATYMRKDGRLYFDEDFDTCLPYNYCMYKNTAYNNKWFYAFVTDLRFESNNSCSATLVTDVYQTWQFDMTIHPSFIERYIPSKSSDTIGAFTFPEGFELGDYISNDTQEETSLSDQRIVIGSTADYTDLNDSVTGCYQNIPTGCAYYSCVIDDQGTNIDEVRQWIQDLTDVTKQDAIISMFLAPSILCASTDTSPIIKRISNSYTPTILTRTLTTAVAGLNGYVPHNNKLYTYPFYYILVTNGAGGNAIIKPELWNSSTHQYRIFASLTPGCSIVGMPLEYAGHSVAWEEALPLGKYPELSWSADLYTNWQTQNGLNNTIQKISGGINAVSGAFNIAESLTAIASSGIGDGAGRDLQMGFKQYTGGMMQTLDAMKEQYLAELVPAQFSGNTNSGDVWASNNKITFRFNWMSIRQEAARRIDLFFDMYGYKVNRLGNVLTNTRSNWNYIKTIDVNITGDIPENDIQILKSLYNRGFTIWHTTTHFLDYSQTNS